MRATSARSGGNMLAQAKAYEKGFLESLTDWRSRLLLNVCSTTQGRELIPGAQFVRDVVSRGIVNESWRVLRTSVSDSPVGVDQKKGGDVLATIWTNPAWGSWSVEDLQEGTPFVRSAVLYMLPMIEEMRRRETPPITNTPASDSASPESPGSSESTDPFATPQ